MSMYRGHYSIRKYHDHLGKNGKNDMETLPNPNESGKYYKYAINTYLT